MENIMLDLETMGKDSNAAIVSIGAVAFDLETGETGQEFFLRVDLDSCLKLGMTVSASTIYWWLAQSDEAREMVYDGFKMPIQEAVQSFSKFYRDVSIESQIWGNGLDFDCTILENAYKASDIILPWAYDKKRDVRTLVGFNPKIKRGMKFEGIPHDPIADCKHQIKYCAKTWQSLKKN